MNQKQPVISVNVDVANPGQFFACCGLLELADRLWHGAFGWFDESLTVFNVSVENCSGAAEGLLIDSLAKCDLRNTMSVSEIARLDELRKVKKKEMTQLIADEKKHLEKLWRDSPLKLGNPIETQLDWFLDSRSGGNRLKTWAGQQSVFDIAESMKKPINDGAFANLPASTWIQQSVGTAIGFNFDADASVQSSPLDVGFSLDPLKMGSSIRPFLELLAFVGLQRFRPSADESSNSYSYSTWITPLTPLAAAPVVAGYVELAGFAVLSFSLLFRTKYLKSFLPSTFQGDFQ